MQAGAAAAAAAHTNDDDENGMIDNNLTMFFKGVGHGFSQQVRACICSQWSPSPPPPAYRV